MKIGLLGHTSMPLVVIDGTVDLMSGLAQRDRDLGSHSHT